MKQIPTLGSTTVAILVSYKTNCQPAAGGAPPLQGGWPIENHSFGAQDVLMLLYGNCEIDPLDIMWM